VAVGAGYLYVRGRNLPRSTDINLFAPVPTQVPIQGGGTVTVQQFPTARPFTNFDRIIQFESTAESEYNGLTLELRKRSRGRFQGAVAYTLGKVEDTVPDATAVVPGSTGDDLKYASNPVNFDVDRTDGANDQRHRLVLSGVYNTSLLAEGKDGFARALVNGWTFGVIFSAGSGQPYTARVGAFDLNNDGNPRNDIAPGTVRNEFRLPRQVTFDPRIARDIPLGRQARVQLIWEAFNLFNADNFSSLGSDRYSVNGTTNVLTPTTNFGQPLSSSGPRIMQVAAKFSF
jgi:hypothetical protein